MCSSKSGKQLLAWVGLSVCLPVCVKILGATEQEELGMERNQLLQEGNSNGLNVLCQLVKGRRMVGKKEDWIAKERG